MIPFDPPNTFRNGQTLDQNDVQENVHHWVQLIKRIAEQRYIHSAAFFRFGESLGTNITENQDSTQRTIRWYSPYDVYVEGVACFLNQATAVTAAMQWRFSGANIPTGQAGSVLLSCTLAGTNTTNLVQAFSKKTSFFLAKSTTYDIIFEAVSSSTFDLRMLDLQMNIRTDRWSSDSSIPTSTQKRIDASGNVSATNINAILADVEADIATCQSNEWIPTANSFNFTDFTGSSISHLSRCQLQVTDEAGIQNKWGNCRFRGIQATYALTVTSATTNSGLAAELVSKSGTVQLSTTSLYDSGGSGSTLFAHFASTAVDINAVSGDLLDDTADDKKVIADAYTGTGGNPRAINVNIIVWDG